MNELHSKLQQEIAAGEKWLAGFATPSASLDVVERTKRAVQHELAQQGRSRSAVRHWAAWHGVLAAAASIGLAVTIGWYSFEKHDTPGAAAKGELLAVWSTETQDEVSRFAGLDEGLSDLEELSADRPWALNGASMYEALEGALEGEANDNSTDTGALLSPSGGGQRQLGPVA